MPRNITKAWKRAHLLLTLQHHSAAISLFSTISTRAEVEAEVEVEAEAEAEAEAQAAVEEDAKSFTKNGTRTKSGTGEEERRHGVREEDMGECREDDSGKANQTISECIQNFGFVANIGSGSQAKCPHFACRNANPGLL
eukprot:scaffold124117_cov47-Attheya_sp.AAC.2